MNNMSKENPFFSIVIANYNYGHLLPTTLESIVRQDCDDYEIIVVDGGSSDDSVDVIKRYSSHIKWWVSEPDKGQSDAFNKGFAHAQGKFYTWVNADDILLPGTLKTVKQALMTHPDYDWATGNMVNFLHSNGKIIKAPWGPNILPKWLMGNGRQIFAFGPTTFWSKRAYEEVGPFNTEMHYMMDTDYWVRLMVHGYKQLRVNHFCWGFRMHTDSKTAEYGGNVKSAELKEIIEMEHEKSNRNNDYHISAFFVVMLRVWRVIDGSYIKAIANKYFVEGKHIGKYFNLSYDLRLGSRNV